jgi:hypothetical protein
MLIGLIGLLLSLIISLLWFLPGIRAQGDNQVLTRNDYVKTALVYGLCFTCLLIIISEVIWDNIADQVGLSGLLRDINCFHFLLHL